jgi:hypothetical protein
MTPGTPGRSRSAAGRPFCWTLIVACAAVSALAPTPLHAQEPPPPPVADTIAITLDSDTLPPLRFPVLGRAPQASFALGVWRWDRNALLNETAVSLADLLERVPGLFVIRSGTTLQPAAVSAFGSGAQLEVEIDGFVLDPFHAAAIELSEIPLAYVTELVVERRLDGIRLRIRTDEATAAQPYTRVEAGIGLPTAALFRGIFLAPRFGPGPFGVGVERTQGDGIQGREPADNFAGWLKWGWVRERFGVQLEHRRHTLRRTGQSPWPDRLERSDFILRGRALLADGLVGDVYIGRTTEDREVAGDTLGAFERSGLQAGVRAGFEQGPVSILGAVRLRDADALPRGQATIRAAFMQPRFGAHVEVEHAAWDAAGATAFSARATVAPLPAIVLFAEAAAGQRGTPFHEDPAAPAVITRRTALRAGAELHLLGATLGGALLHLDTDSVAAFRLPFDSLARSFAGGTVTGWEASGRIAFWQQRLRLFGSATTWFSGDPWVYLPELEGRGGAELRLDPLPSGNLEIEGRLFAVHRGLSLVPLNAADPAAPIAVAPQSTRVVGEIFLRIIDVRIFLRYDDMAAGEAALLPGRPPGGPRLMYGVKWHFWN